MGFFTIQPTSQTPSKGKVAAKDLSKLLPSSLSLAGITITNSQGVVINFGEINGDVSNSINQLKEQNTSEAAELAKLLEQLQTSLNADTDLKDEDKADALERVKVLAEVGKPKDGAMRRVANTAIKVVRGTVTALPPTTKLIENVNNLLHEITKLLDLS